MDNKITNITRKELKKLLTVGYEVLSTNIIFGGGLRY